MDETLKSIISAVSKFIDEISRAAGVKRSVSLFDIGQYAQDLLDAETPPAPEGETEAPQSYVLDVRADGKEISVIATKSDGKMYKAPVTVGADNSITVGEYSEVQIEYTPTSREITVKRQADGRVRWFALPACTAVLNRSGEIDSRALFRSFEEYAIRTNEYPKLDFYHKGEKLILGQGDQVAAIGYGYCVTGLFDETDIARATIKALEDDPAYWGTSIAYVPTAEPEVMRSIDGGADINVYNAGINPYVSLLPEKRAASIMTSIGTSEGVKRMTKDEEEALKKLTGGDEELFNKSKLKLDSVDRSVEDQNMIRRDGAITQKETHVIETSTPQAAAGPTDATSEARAMTPDDMTMILGSPEFEAKVTEIVKKLQAGDNPAPDANAPQNQDAVTPVVEDAQTRENTELRTALTTLTAQFETLRTSVADLAKEPGQIAREILDDMPAKFKNPQNIVRARNAPAPIDLKTKKANLAEVAASGMDKIRQQKATAQ